MEDLFVYNAISFKNNCTISQETIDKIVLQLFEICKKELPKEAHTVEVMNYIVDEIKDKANSLTLEL